MKADRRNKYRRIDVKMGDIQEMFLNAQLFEE